MALYSCSSKKKRTELSGVAFEEKYNDKEGSELLELEPEEDIENFLDENKEMAIILGDQADGSDPVAEVIPREKTEAAPVERQENLVKNPIIKDELEVSEPVVAEEVVAVENSDVEITGVVKTYKVEEDETLMLVAFKIYGDYRMWRQLKNMNKDRLSSNFLRKGQTLQFYAPAKVFTWKVFGNPYLIKTGDTLGLISNSTYGTTSKWKDIWNNNRPIIRNPNLIFAGFTIYLPELDKKKEKLALLD